MSQLIENVLPLALGAAVSPLLLTVGVLYLASDYKPRLKAALFASGAASVLIILGVVGLIVFDGTIAKKTAAHTTTSAWISLVAGLVLVLLLLRSLIGSKKSDVVKQPKEQTSRGSSVITAYFSGVAMMVLNFTSIVLFIPAVKEMARADVGSMEKAIALAVTILIVTIPATLPLILTLLMPKRSTVALKRLNSWTSTHTRVITNVLLAVFSVYLLFKGISELN